MLEGITWFRQSAMRWRGDGPVVYVDPWGVTDPAPADLILITHAHFDHFQPEEIERLRTATTKLVAPKDVAAELSGDVTAVAPGSLPRFEFKARRWVEIGAADGERA